MHLAAKALAAGPQSRQLAAPHQPCQRGATSVAFPEVRRHAGMLAHACACDRSQKLPFPEDLLWLDTSDRPVYKALALKVRGLLHGE